MSIKTLYNQENKLGRNILSLYLYNMKDIEKERWSKAVELTQDSIDIIPSEYRENLSDGYHTFKELYDFRKMYNAALFNEWAATEVVSIDINNPFKLEMVDVPKYQVHKSWKHNDGELCFGGGWFIVSAQLPTGQISNHYKMEDWDLFKIPVVEKALYPFDGHTSADVLERLKNI